MTRSPADEVLATAVAYLLSHHRPTSPQDLGDLSFLRARVHEVREESIIARRLRGTGKVP